MTEYKDISAKCWELFKKYMNAIPQTDKGWSDLLAEFNALANKYKGTKYERYAIEYCVCCSKEIEREWRREKK